MHVYKVKNIKINPSFGSRSMQLPSLSSNNPRKLLKNVQLADLLPNKAVHERLVQRWAVLISRVVCKYMAKLQHLQSIVIYHIPHKYSKEMAAKSETVRIFIQVYIMVIQYSWVSCDVINFSGGQLQIKTSSW